MRYHTRGTSPRTRGKPVHDTRCWQARRNIPAHAGKTGVSDATAVLQQEHPRARGENTVRRVLPLRSGGTSPRTRGKLILYHLNLTPSRNIPAHAGKTALAIVEGILSQEHPRARGENLRKRYRTHHPRGTSPRTRGKHDDVYIEWEANRNIPAHAGKTVFLGRVFEGQQEHPRARGENDDHASEACHMLGTSPRTRGKRGHWGARGLGERNIPAHAGKTKPQVKAVRGIPGTSPRTRGKHSIVFLPTKRLRNIPAHAGKTIVWTRLRAQSKEHPRARGENCQRFC